VNILLIEDDNLLAEQISMLLRKERYICDLSHNVEEAMALYDQNSYQLILMDWNLPDGSGIEILKEIRNLGDRVSVLMLSGRESVDERVEALDAGADDYLCKPYSNSELLARVRALLRRESSQKTTTLMHGDVIVDLAKREVRVDDDVKRLTEKEFKLLELLMLHKNKVLSRFDISELLSKDFDAIRGSNVVDQHVKNIRKKLDRPELISAVRSVGYTIRD
jgi:DNA-binding response OmpR family regulator